MIIASAWIWAIVGRQTAPLLPQTPDVEVPKAYHVQVTPPGAAQDVTVDEAVAIAYKNQPAIQIAKGNQTIAEGQTTQTKAAGNPLLATSAGYGSTNVLSGLPAGTTGTSFTTSATLSLLVFDFGKTREAIHQQEALERAAKHSVTQAESDATQVVKVAFYELAQDQNLVIQAEANVKNSQSQLALAQARVGVGTGAPSDLVLAKTALGSAVIALTNARTTAENSRLTLTTVMGIDPRIPISVKDSSESEVSGTPDELVNQALKQRPEIVQAVDKVEAAHAGLRNAKVSSAPSLSVSAGYGSRSNTNPFSAQTDSLAINLNWNLLDGGLSAGKVHSAEGSLSVAEQGLRQLGLTVAQDVISALLAKNSAETRVTTAQAEVANATELVRIQSGRYSGGIGQFLDVTSAQTSLFNAQRDLITAKSDLQKARANLKHAIGPRPLK